MIYFIAGQLGGAGVHRGVCIVALAGRIAGGAFARVAAVCVSRRDGARAVGVAVVVRVDVAGLGAVAVLIDFIAGQLGGAWQNGHLAVVAVRSSGHAGRGAVIAKSIAVGVGHAVGGGVRCRGAGVGVGVGVVAVFGAAKAIAVVVLWTAAVVDVS